MDICDGHWKMFEEMEEEAMNISLNFSVMPSQLDTSFNLTTLTTSDDVEIENAVKIIALRLELKGTLNSGKFSKQEMPYRTYNRKIQNFKCIIEAISNVMVDDSKQLIIDTCRSILKDKNF